MAKTQGLERLKAKIAALPTVSKIEMMASLNQSADELAAMQKRLVAVDEGDTRESIEKIEGKHELQIIVQAGGKKAPHARWLEFGTVKAAARPFFWPSYRSLRKRIKSRASRASGKAAKKVAAGGQ